MFLSFSQDLYNLQYYQIYNYNPINHDIITKIMMEQTPQNNKERSQEKREKRSKLKEFLPDDLVLEYSKNIKPHKWTFDGNLVNRRNLATDAETIFFKALEYYNNNTLDEHFLELKDNKEKQRHSLSITLEADINLSKGLEECAKNGEWVYYATILSKMIEMGKDIPKNVDEQMSKGLEECAENGRWNSYTTILSKMIEMGKATDKQMSKGLEGCAKNGEWVYYATILSKMIEMGKATDEQMSKGLEGCAKNGEWNSYTTLLSKMIEMGKDIPKNVDEQMSKGLEGYAKNGEWVYYATILSKMIEMGKATDEQMSKGLEGCAKNGEWNSYTTLLSKMIEMGKATDEQMSKGLEGCAKNGEWNYYTTLLSKMIEMGKDIPKATDEQMSKGLEGCAKNGRWGYYATILSKMIEMGKIDFNNPTYQRVNEHINSLSEKYQSFVRGNIVARLNTGQSLESFHTPNGSYAIYQSLVPSSIVVNQEIQDETKKVREPDIWWQEHGKIFGKLLALDSKLISGLIKEHISEGIPKLNGYITIYEQAISNTIAFNLTKQAIEDNRFNHPQELGSFLEIVNAYGKGGQMELLQNIINQKSNIHLNERASKELLGVIAMNLGIPKEEIKTNLNEWKTEFLPNLVSNDEMMVIKKMEEARELYLSIMKAVFKNLWKEFLFDKNQDDEVGRSVALHNAETREIFEKNGINYDKWLSYDKHRDFIVSTEVVVDKKEYYLKILNERKEQVIKTLLPFSGILTEREYFPLLHILEGQGNKKSLDKLNGSELTQKLEQLEDRLKNLKQREEYKNNQNWDSVFEHTGHLREAVIMINQKEHKETESREKGFRIKVWERDPKKDLFQGNYSQCCIAVGVKDTPPDGGLNTHDPSTVMQFLADTGISVVEICDSERNNPVGNAWLFVSKNELGEPIMVVDNVELHKDYTNDPHLNNMIRDNLFSFLADYAKDVSLVGAGVGLVPTNNIDTSDMRKMNVPPVDIISGYLTKYTSDIGNRSGRYYLETFNHPSLGEIVDFTKEKIEIKKKKEKMEEIKQTGIIRMIDIETNEETNFNNNQFYDLIES